MLDSLKKKMLKLFKNQLSNCNLCLSSSLFGIPAKGALCLKENFANETRCNTL